MNSRFQLARASAVLATGVLACSIVLGGCESDAQTGTLLGVGIGALAGQAIGGDTGATLIGAAVGGGVGYVIGNEEDKKKAERMGGGGSSAAGGGTGAAAAPEVAPLGGTRWEVISLAPADEVPPYRSKVVEFRPDGQVITTTTRPDGSVEVSDEHYRVVGSTLIINKPGYLVNARYSIEGDQLVIDAEQFRAVLSRMRA